MVKDSSLALYERCLELNDKNIEVILKNGRTIRGVFVGHFVGDDSDNPSIVRWHIADSRDAAGCGTDGLGVVKGEIIKQRAIAEVRFMEDDSILKF